MAAARRCKFLFVVAGLVLTATGCMHGSHVGQFGSAPMPNDANAHIQVPPEDAVPREMKKITLPPYVIEAPDQLLIEVVQRTKITEFDTVTGRPLLDKDGNERKKDATIPLTVQPISGPFQVRLDGTVGLGFWGAVPVAGLTLDQAAEAIKAHLARETTLNKFETKPESIIVIVDVIAYNSKRYYVIVDGGGQGAGEQVVSLPITGGETVLDAISNIGGLSDVSSRRNIWVARRTPHAGQPWQILPVDWVGLSQHGITYTNYQLLPGDRVYVKAQRLVTIDRTLARVIAPVERIFGITLLGSSTVNQIAGRGNGFGNNN
ncbi:polysaccharide export protein : Wza OS=Blastopirellula marina DSM 3645 GN=DSM3645_28367 PE=4 SV=1: Poly_export [Gemmata massiliana]|uniref:Polysaccharide export protein N-terminal domain-containing protein n=1 Tax=Gemmata massiliana TaxID=1210884 RepID=A0A6P2D7M8_9BACT|nr:polysaccharide biosynthesis/export family protein [Gemmata massiliana]VTR96937.1 polysaccharide export protein : Wza OS=Blastopirellula marina DSM 3645 GN=DSM3645_28367 PE=4 SV=1: Poly_export [Gemmata massiliana]